MSNDSCGYLLDHNCFALVCLSISQANAASGMAVHDDCKLRFLELKTKRTHRFIVFKIEENQKQVIVEKLGEPAQGYKDFAACLPPNECHYAIYDFKFLSEGNVPKSRIFFIACYKLISKQLQLEMYLLESKAGAIVCVLLSLFFLGTWPSILTLLERRWHLPQHTYLDYSLTNFLAALFIAFTVGEIGKSTPSEPNFLAQLAQDNWPSVLFAMGGGVVLSLGNLASQYAFAFVGLSITEVITASITVVIGTSLNYFLDGKINRAEILFPGVGCFLIAVCLGSDVHSSNTADNKVKLSNLSSDYNAGSVDSFTEGGLDVICTDRTLVFYEKQENLSKLWDILAIYAWLDKDVVYGQGLLAGTY
ncbi:hypothetical protein S245_056521 [Arachis hypogaea]